MALVLNDRVKETTTTTGTGTVNLAGAETGFETFVAGIGNTNTTYYAIVHQSAAEFEVGLGTVSDSSPDTLSRTTIISSSNSDSAVNFSAGTKDVFCTLPASKAVFGDASGNVGIGTTSPASPLHIRVGTNNNLEIEETAGDLRLLAINDARAANVPMEFAASRFEFLTGNVGIGTASASEKLTVNGNIANTSGDMTIDVAGDIILDADGDNVYFDAGGGHLASFSFINNDVYLGVETQDYDLIIRGNDGGSTITALTLDMSDAGRALFNGSVDIGGGTITRTGDLTLDASGDIILDADGDNVYLKAGGGNQSSFSFINGDVYLGVETQDKDLIIRGNDGGSTITALTLDMSEGGEATFNSHINLPDNARIKLGASDDLQIYHDGSNSYVVDNGTGGLYLRGTNTVDIQSASGHNYLKSTISAGTQIYFDNSEKFATVSGGIKVTGDIANASGNMTIDVADDLTLDADGEHIRFKDGGTEIGNIDMGSNNLNIRAVQSDKDILFLVNDGGSEVTALLLDGSEAGAATFNSTVSFKFIINNWIQSAEGDERIYYANSGETYFRADGSHLFRNGSDNTIANIDSSGNGTFAGNVTAYGSPSDIRLKENVEVIDNALDKVKQLKGITYDLKSDGNRLTGLIAQDLEKVLPEAVYETSDVDDEDKHLAIRYGNTVGLLVEAIKEQQEQIETLTARVKELEGK